MLLLICLVYLCILLAVHSLHLDKPTGITLHPTLQRTRFTNTKTYRVLHYTFTESYRIISWTLEFEMLRWRWLDYTLSFTHCYYAYRCINIGITFGRICLSSITNRIHDITLRQRQLDNQVFQPQYRLRGCAVEIWQSDIGVIYTQERRR